MEVKVLDVSKHNGAVDFVKVKASGVYGVIIRAGFGKVISQKDPKFEEYYNAAKAAGLRVGAYWYSYAASPAEAITEANVFLEVIKDKAFELPVYFDIEEKSQVAKGKDICSNMVYNFCSTMEKAGYYAGVYSFDSFFASNLTPDVAKRFTCWVARVENIKPTSCKSYDMWQYTWKAHVSGVNGDADMSYLYKDFESIVKKNFLNGFKKVVIKKFSVTARISGLSFDNASKIEEACQKLGMAVTKSEE